jgi:hypothetical protein
MIILKPVLTIFVARRVFQAGGAVAKNWLEPKTTSPHENLTC